MSTSGMYSFDSRYTSSDPIPSAYLTPPQLKTDVQSAACTYSSKVRGFLARFFRLGAASFFPQSGEHAC